MSHQAIGSRVARSSSQGQAGLGLYLKPHAGLASPIARLVSLGGPSLHQPLAHKPSSQQPLSGNPTQTPPKTPPKVSSLMLTKDFPLIGPIYLFI